MTSAAWSSNKSNSTFLRWQLAFVSGTAVVLSLLAEDWILGLGIFVLWGIWHYVPNPVGPPVVSLALTHQWLQVLAGVLYFGLTQRRVEAMDLTEYRPMMLIGLGCVLALAMGLVSGMRMSKVTNLYDEKKVDVAFSWHELILLYAICLGLTGIVHELAWNIPALTQGILAITFIRFGLLYLIFNRLMNPDIRFGWVGLFLVGEVVLGFTG